MNRRVLWLGVVAGVVGVTAGCGDTTGNDSGPAFTGGADAAGEGPTTDAGNGRWPLEFEPCPGSEEEFLNTVCDYQVVTPSTLAPGAPGAAGAAGAAGAGGAPGGAAAGLCHVPIGPEGFNPNETHVYIDCQLIPHIERRAEEDPPESWRYNDLDDSPVLVAIVLSDALCSRLEDTGFERFEILYGCG